MKLLELFSGAGSVGKVAKELGYDVVSLDLKNADINTDILQWNYKQFKQNEFNIIWASPPCTEYSRAKTTGIRKIDYANSVVKKTIEIINYFNPSIWFIENPEAGLLKQQDYDRL
jgi:site-specific DNA-cytosine methylase